MKFERLNVPDWELPDLVAFNREGARADRSVVGAQVGPPRHLDLCGTVHPVRGDLDLFRERPALVQSLLAYQPPLPTNVRGYDGTPVQTFARERRVELSYDEYPPLVVHAFISAEDKGFFTHHGIDFRGLIGAVADYATKSVDGRGAPRADRRSPSRSRNIC